MSDCSLNLPDAKVYKIVWGGRGENSITNFEHYTFDITPEKKL